MHFHEWMAGVAVPMMRKDNCSSKIVFTTHATLLGRYLAMNDPNFYERLSWVDWEKEAEYFNLLSANILAIILAFFLPGAHKKIFLLLFIHFKVREILEKSFLLTNFTFLLFFLLMLFLNNDAM